MLQEIAHLRVVVIAGNERQAKSAGRLEAVLTSPDGHPFQIHWIAAGYDPSHRVLAVVEKSIASSQIVLISPRVGKIIRGRAFDVARREGVGVVQLTGPGTGLTGVVRVAEESVDEFHRQRGES